MNRKANRCTVEEHILVSFDVFFKVRGSVSLSIRQSINILLSIASLKIPSFIFDETWCIRQSHCTALCFCGFRGFPLLKPTLKKSCLCLKRIRVIFTVIIIVLLFYYYKINKYFYFITYFYLFILIVRLYVFSQGPISNFDSYFLNGTTKYANAVSLSSNKLQSNLVEFIILFWDFLISEGRGERIRLARMIHKLLFAIRPHIDSYISISHRSKGHLVCDWRHRKLA